MAVIGEVALPPNSFPLGRLLTADRDLHIEFERVVPVDDGVLPIFWAWGGDLEAFEQRLRKSDDVSAFTPLQRVDGRSLYSITWSTEAEGFIDGLAATEALILRAHGHDDDSWDFRLLFSSHEKLSNFHNFCHDLDLTYTLGRVYALSGEGLERPVVTLTDEQREALQLALDAGYFDTPSRVTLTELARKFDISQQALSQRIRRGNKAILEQILVRTPSDTE